MIIAGFFVTFLVTCIMLLAYHRVGDSPLNAVKLAALGLVGCWMLFYASPFVALFALIPVVAFAVIGTLVALCDLIGFIVFKVFRC